MRENAGGLFQVRDITCGCGRRLRVPVLGDVYSLVREGIEAEQREESELLLKFALDEIERLRAALTKANAQAERFEREWYLRGDEIEQLRADAERYRWLRGGPDVPSYSSRWPRWEVRYWDGRYWQTMFAEDLDATIDAAMKEQEEK